MPIHFEDAVKILDANQHDAYALARHIPELVEGLKDASSRLQHLELSASQIAHRLANLEEANNAWAAQLASLASDRDAFRKRIDDVEKIPAASAKTLADIDKRLRAVEGAVGSSAYKGTADKPILPTAAAKPADTTFAQKIGLTTTPAPAPPVV